MGIRACWMSPCAGASFTYTNSFSTEFYMYACRVWPIGTSNWRTRCWTEAGGRCSNSAILDTQRWSPNLPLPTNTKPEHKKALRGPGCGCPSPDPSAKTKQVQNKTKSLEGGCLLVCSLGAGVTPRPLLVRELLTNPAAYCGARSCDSLQGLLDRFAFCGCGSAA